MDPVIKKIIGREKGYVNHPKDRGGPTKYGITQGTLSKHLGRPATAADVAKLTPEAAADIYDREYASRFRFIKDEKLRDLVTDSAVHHGPQDAIRFLQKAAGLQPDGLLGPQTVDAVSKMPVADVYDRVLGQRVRKIQTLGRGNKTFAAGWNKRLEEFMQ